MKIDFNYKFVSLDGKKIPETREKDSPQFTLKTACVNALLGQEVDERGRPKEMNGEEKVKRYSLSKKIYDSKGLLDLRTEEIALIKKLIGRVYPPLTVGQAFEILDPHSVDEKKGPES